MKTHESTMRKSLVLLAGVACTAMTYGAFVRTIEAPNGVGDVVALTNAITELNALSDVDTLDSRIYLKPGLYDLRGVHMTSSSHLSIEHARNFIFAGLGNGPEDTILLGGGKAEGHRVIQAVGGGNYWWNTYSNMTVTGGYTSGSGGGICEGSLGTLYVCCIISNNTSTSTARYHGGGGCLYGVAKNCLFADNTAGNAGGALDPHAKDKSDLSLKPYATDCIFSNNHVTATWNANYGGGAVTGGRYTRCKFYHNTCVGSGGAVGKSEDCPTAVVVDCEFVGNSCSGSGGAVYKAAAITNCAFVCNVGGTNGGAVFDYGDLTAAGYAIVGCGFTNNTASSYNGGAIYIMDRSITNCTFVGNVGGAKGGAIYAEGTQGLFSGCTFVSNSLANWGYGGALYAYKSAKAVGCTLTGNSSAQGCVGYNVDFTDSIITNNAGTYAFYNANLTRCHVADNVTSEGNAVLDFVSTANTRTNVNCVFVRNRQSNYGSLSSAKVIVNCAYLDNWYGNGNYSPLFVKSAIVYNSVFAGNRINGGTYCDIRTAGNGWKDDYPTLVNCIFSKTDGKADGAGHWTDCFQVARDKLKFTKSDLEHPLTPTRISKMFNNGNEAGWILSLVGDTDYYGRARIRFGALDIGPVESLGESLAFMLFVQ